MKDDQLKTQAEIDQAIADKARAALIAKYGEAEFERMCQIAWEALLLGDPNPTFVPWDDESDWETKP